ncbi:response regulator [Hyphomicrobium sp. ghe19]|uniref:response regulator n=1 Tax=Hyphomicrobium sp. ghe19 TaxID=2682968 RepID=UPI0013676796|nr:Response regulator rcp1 [Hyphomicrobium sp. ghe19]
MTPQLGTILSIEDNDTDFMTLEFALRSAGVKNPLERLDNGSAALQILVDDDANSPVLKASLVLLDLNLPGVDGLQLLKALRARDPGRRTPVLVLSTSSHPRDIDACYLAGADGYLVKPFELEAWESDVGGVAERWLSETARDRVPQKSADKPPIVSKKCKSRVSKLAKLDPEIHRAMLTRTIEGEIIPRLLLAHGGLKSARRGSGDINIEETADEVAELVHLVLASDIKIATSYIETRRLRGVTLEALFHALIVPAARLIGDLWKADICSFHEFSEGLARLQLMLAELQPKPDNSTLH